jgi:hypothetical protein
MGALGRYLLAILRGDTWTIARTGPYLLLGGMIAIALSSIADGVGILTAWNLAGLGATGAALSDWRKERGLWMLASLMFLLYGAIYVIACVAHVLDQLRGAPALPAELMLDVLSGAALLGIILRFSFRVAIDNYFRFRPQTSG